MRVSHNVLDENGNIDLIQKWLYRWIEWIEILFLYI